MKYLITYHTKLDNGYIDERQIILKNKYNAKRIYDKLAGKKRTINIEMEEINWPLLLLLTVFQLITKIKLFYYQNPWRLVNTSNTNHHTLTVLIQFLMNLLKYIKTLITIVKATTLKAIKSPKSYLTI